LKQAFVLTLGCPKNQADSDVFSRCLELAGYILSTDPEEADLLVLNSCAFIKPAVDESLETMEQAVQWKGRRRGRRLVLAGCLPGRFTWDESDELKEWDLIIGPGDSAGLMRFLDRELGRKSPGGSGTGPVRYLQVFEGCSNYCTY